MSTSGNTPPPRGPRLGDPPCLAFPFRIGESGPAVARRGAHVRSQIEQVLFTSPGERVFRADFGAGVEALVFEPNRAPLWELVKRRIQASLGEVLRGEVDPNSVDVDVTGQEERLEIVVRYRLATIGVDQVQRFTIGAAAGGKDG